MQILVGNILVATSLLNDTYFEKSIILITEKNVNGTIGFVINKKYEQTLNNLVEFSHSKPIALYKGGPVETEKLYFIHNQQSLIHNSTKIEGAIYFGGNFKQAVQLFNNSSLKISDIQIFIGYCGWDAYELEAEIEEGSWLLYNQPTNNIEFLQSLDWNSLFQSFSKNK